jgi:hypothetical protein
MNDYSDAERVARDRVSWAEHQYGDSTPQVAGFLSLLAEVKRLEAKYREAEPAYTRALSIYRALKLDNCLVAGQVYTGLAETYLR